MLRSVLAGVLGAVSAVAAAFVVVAVMSAIGGVPVMFDPDRQVYGWEGAQYGMLLFAALGAVKVWPFPAIALVGAALGVLARSALRRRSAASPPAAR